MSLPSKIEFPGDDGPSAATAAWWRQLFVDAANPQFVCDEHGRVRDVNHQAARLLPIERGVTLAQSDVFDPATLAIIVANTGGPIRAIALPAVGVRTKAGETVPLDLKISYLEDGSRWVNCEDASRRLRLETHTQRLVAAIDSTPDVVILTDDEFRITFVNPAFAAATGHLATDALHRPVDSFHAPGQSDKVREYEDGVRRGADWVGELVMQRRDGTTYPVDMSFSPVSDPHGRFIGAVAFQRDISGRKQLQDAVLLERNFARSIINSLDACLYTLDGKLRLTHFNSGWRRMAGGEHGWIAFKEAPQVGQCLLDCVVDDTRRAQLAKAFQEVLAEGRPQELQTVDGRGHHWLMSVFAWHHDGQIRGLIYRVTDNSTLAGVQKQLFQAQKMSTLGSLVAGVAHDFNNLLLAMRGNLSLVTMDPQLALEPRARLQQVDDAAVRATDLSRQLLAFSRPSEEQVTVLDFNQIVREAGDLARRVLRGRVKLVLTPTPEPLKVQLDRTQAIQVLLNLCINASDAMPKGGTLTLANALADLTMAQKTRIKHKDSVQFMRCSVTDTGTGIPPEILPQIFNPFFTTKPPGKGTGLGLAIVSNVISRAGGFIEIESTVGVGTTFQIYLPLEVGPLTRTDTELRQQICKGTGRLLVVDDLDLVLEFAANFLRQAGYQVLTANSADAALKVLAQQKMPVDLLFTDYTMPGRNGWQLIQEATVRWPLLKCVLASGYIDEQERAEIHKAAQVRLLNKPYGIPEATRVIAEVLGQYPTESTTRPDRGL